MNARRVLIDSVIVFAITLIASITVTLLWSRIVHGASTVDWAMSFRFAVIFSVLLTWIEARRRKGAESWKP